VNVTAFKLFFTTFGRLKVRAQWTGFGRLKTGESRPATGTGSSADKGMGHEIRVDRDNNWYPNQVVFTTKEEAEATGLFKWTNWTMAGGYPVLEADRQPNTRGTTKNASRSGGRRKKPVGAETPSVTRAEVQKRFPTGSSVRYQGRGGSEQAGDVLSIETTVISHLPLTGGYGR
jgi:hypothetical protein